MSKTLEKQAPQNYAGIAPGTEAFRMKSLKPGEKQHSINTINSILDNLDEIQGLIGLQEYCKQLSHWQAVLSAVENEL